MHLRQCGKERSHVNRCRRQVWHALRLTGAVLAFRGRSVSDKTTMRTRAKDVIQHCCRRCVMGGGRVRALEDVKEFRKRTTDFGAIPKEEAKLLAQRLQTPPRAATSRRYGFMTENEFSSQAGRSSPNELQSTILPMRLLVCMRPLGCCRWAPRAWHRFPMPPSHSFKPHRQRYSIYLLSKHGLILKMNPQTPKFPRA